MGNNGWISIVDGRWTPKVIMLKLRCSCSRLFEVRSDRRRVECPDCYTQADLLKMKSKMTPRAYIRETVMVRRRDLEDGQYAKLVKDLTAQKSRFGGDEDVELFQEDDGWLWLPRVYGFRMLKSWGFKFRDDRATLPDIPFKVNRAILDQPPYPKDQSTLVDTVVKETKANRFGGFAVAPTASGKTLMGSYVGAGLGGPTLIVVHKSDLIKNWRRSITENIRVDGKPPRIGYIRGKTCQYGPDYPFVIAMVASLAQKDFQDDLYQSFRTIIGDEIHHLPAATFFDVFSRFQARYLVGFTATLRRKDGLDEVFSYVIGDVLYQMVRDGVDGRIYFIEVPFLIAPGRLRAAGRLSLSKIGTTFAALEHRNVEIIKHVLAAYKKGRKNLVLSGTRDHLTILHEMLPPIVRKRTGFYVGGQRETVLDSVSQKQILLGTYGMAYEGMDVPDLDMLTLATPVKDIEQPVGRILRKHESKMDPLVVDFVDRYPPLVRWARERAGYYRGEGFKICTPIPV